jgi:anti-sigma factor RsiW
VRVRAGLRAAARSEPRPLAWRAFLLGAACGVASVAAWNPALLGWRSPAGDELERQVLAAHLRSVSEGGRLMDVASSDQHTVKPWFTGKLDYAPPVREASDAGFALGGARVDQVGGRPVAALVYRYRLHLVNVFVWPAEGETEVAPRARSPRGFTVLSWSCAGMQYWAASDVAAAELTRLAQASCAR